jgi:hypothetical protein
MFPLSIKIRYQILIEGWNLWFLYAKTQGNKKIFAFDDDLEPFGKKIAQLSELCGMSMTFGSKKEMRDLSDQDILDIEHTTKILKVGIRFLPRLKKKLQGVRTRRLTRLCIFLAQRSLSKQ